MIAKTVLDAMAPSDQADATIGLWAGMPLALASRTEIHVDANNNGLAIKVRDRKHLAGTWHIGAGPRAPILKDGLVVGTALYEPYLVIENGILRSIDGGEGLVLPINRLA